MRRNMKRNPGTALCMSVNTNRNTFYPSAEHSRNLILLERARLCLRRVCVFCALVITP